MKVRHRKVRHRKEANTRCAIGSRNLDLLSPQLGRLETPFSRNLIKGIWQCLVYDWFY